MARAPGVVPSTLRVGKVAQSVVLITWSLALVFVTLFVSGGKGVRTNLDPRLGFRQRLALARSGGHFNALVGGLLAVAAILLTFVVWPFLSW